MRLSYADVLYYRDFWLWGAFAGQALAENGETVLGGGTTQNLLSNMAYDLEDATNSERSVQEIVAMNENAVVEIRTEQVSTDNWMSQYITEGAGSGVIISENGYIVTNNHVIEDASKITVRLKKR